MHLSPSPGLNQENTQLKLQIALAGPPPLSISQSNVSESDRFIVYKFILLSLFILKSVFNTIFTDGPSFNCGVHDKVEENGKLQCEPEGLPEPTFTFRKDGKEITSPPRWTKHDSGNYSLVASNKHGTAIHMIYVDVLCKLYCLESQK